MESKGIIYGLKGRAKCGKTSTLNYVIDILIKKYGKENIDAENSILPSDQNKHVDRRLVINVKTQEGEVKVGVETAGDNADCRIKKSLELFEELGCTVIFCASRTRGGVCKLIKSYKNKGYKVDLKKKHYNDDLDEAGQDAENKKLAKEMVKDASL